jgi:V8-like Glu-specific endopeptidase
MAAARPAEQLVAAPPARIRRRAGLDDHLRRLVPGAAAALAADTGTRWTRGGLVARTTGKVFFSLGGGDYVCSGSAVASGDRSTVATAGHCVYDPDDQRAATNWVFVPGYDRGTAPFGVFVATHLAPMSAWRLSGDFDHDLAFANVDRNAAGKLLTDAVGGQAVGFDTPRGGAAVALGYPAQAPWDGERLIGCAGLLRQDTAVPATTDQGLACTMTGGSSGGPWLTSFDPVTGRGTLVSVTSFGYTDLPGVLWGPYLGSGAKALFQQVSSTTAA